MTPTIKFGLLLGLLFFAFNLVLTYIGIGSATVIQIFYLFIPTMLIYAGIKAFLQKDHLRPAYHYGKGLMIGLGIILTGGILFSLLSTAWQVLKGGEVDFLSDFMLHLWHVFPSSFIVALLVPFFFFGKNEQTASLKDELLDNDL